jgi:hypothetical protein
LSVLKPLMGLPSSIALKAPNKDKDKRTIVTLLR